MDEGSVGKSRDLGKKVTSFFLILLSGFTLDISAATLSEPALFARCYSQVTGHPVPAGHPLMQKVRAGQATALDSCFAVLAKGQLGPTGSLSNPNDPEAVAVLGQFYNFHRSLFNTSSVEQLPDSDREYGSNSDDLFDVSEPALAMTRILFAGNKYSDLVTTIPGMRAMRQPNAPLNTEYGYKVNAPSRRYWGNNFNNNLDGLFYGFRSMDGQFALDGSKSFQVFAPSLVQTGDLVGIRPMTEQMMAPNCTLLPLATAGNEVRCDQSPGLALPFDLFAGAGGGMLGYPIYMMSYWGQPKNTPLNGTTKLPRRWAINTIQNILCSPMPNLRPGDVTQWLDTNSSAPFRHQTSCMGCHAAQDQMAYTLRNYNLAFSEFELLVDMTGNQGLLGKTTEMMAHYNVSLGAVSGWPSEPVANFNQTPPTGRFYYRTLNGQLIDQPVNNVSDLGSKIAATDDYYTCAARRYFQFLTGVQVPLFDRENPANAQLLQNLSPQSAIDRKYVEGLAQQLKNDPNQSLVTLIKTILSSDYNKSPNFRP
jgi:hypothetical protein